MKRGLALFLWFVSAAAVAAPINCHQFWPAAGLPPLACEPHTSTGFPRTLAGAEIRLYRYADGWTDETGQLELLAAVSEAIGKSVPFYGKYAAVPNTYFILYNEVSDEDYADADWQLSTAGVPCRVSLYFNIPNNRDLAKQIAAHEIFHCVQKHGIVPIVSEERVGTLWSARWWVEGSAEYFSSLVEPNGNGELENVPTYRSSIPLYRQPNSYSTAVFFASAAMSGLGPDALVALLKGQPAVSTFAAERRALSENPRVAGLFHEFAERLVDKSIKGAYGKSLPLPEVPAGPAMEVDSGTTQVGLSVVPFTVNRSRLHFGAGFHRKLALTSEVTERKVRVSYRKVGDTEWTPLNPDSDVEIEVPCSDEKGHEYDFVYTSTADSEDNQAFPLKLEGTDKECRCEESAVAVDKCLLGRWRLDNVHYTGWLHSTLARGFHSVEVSGRQDFEFHRNHKAAQKFTGFKVVLNILAGGAITPWIETRANGEVGYRIIQRSLGKMCLRQTSASGTYRYTVGGTGEEGPLGSGIDSGGADARLQYACDARALLLTSEQGGPVLLQWRFEKSP